MTGPRRLAMLLIAVASVLGLAPGTASAADSHQVANIAHRGSGAMAPENTLASVQLALRQGADYIENDIMRTSDGALVITHDRTLVRTTNVEQVFPDRAPWNVADFTLADIKRLDAGSWFSASYAGQRVLTLREWVEAVGSRAGMLLEAKDPWAFPGIERDIDKELRSIPTFTKALAADRVIMQAGDEPWLRAYHDLAPDVPIVDRIHELGMVTHVWTVNFGGDMSRGIAWGVDGIITDYPSVLRDVIRRG